MRVNLPRVIGHDTSRRTTNEQSDCGGQLTQVALVALPCRDW